MVNICKKLSSESPPLFMEAVPILCNLLQYEDRQVFILQNFIHDKFLAVVFQFLVFNPLDLFVALY